MNAKIKFLCDAVRLEVSQWMTPHSYICKDNSLRPTAAVDPLKPPDLVCVCLSVPPSVRHTHQHCDDVTQR